MIKVYDSYKKVNWLDVLNSVSGEVFVGCQKTTCGGSDDLYMDIEGGVKVHFHYDNRLNGRSYACLIVKGDSVGAVDRVCGGLKKGLEDSLGSGVDFVGAFSSCDIK